MLISNSVEYRTYKLCGLYVVAFVSWLICVWYMARFAGQDMCYDEIKLCAQNVLTVFRFNSEHSWWCGVGGESGGGGGAKKENLHLDTCNFCVS